MRPSLQFWRGPRAGPRPPCGHAGSSPGLEAREQSPRAARAMEMDHPVPHDMLSDGVHGWPNQARGGRRHRLRPRRSRQDWCHAPGWLGPVGRHHRNIAFKHRHQLRGDTARGREDAGCHAARYPSGQDRVAARASSPGRGQFLLGAGAKAVRAASRMEAPAGVRITAGHPDRVRRRAAGPRRLPVAFAPSSPPAGAGAPMMLTLRWSCGRLCAAPPLPAGMPPRVCRCSQ